MTPPDSSDTPETPDPFDALGLPRSYAIDPKRVRKAWLHASAGLHPDRSGADPLDEAEAARRSAQINEARRVLDDPELRADALLRLLGGPGKESDKSLPDGFLVSMMETREELEAAAGDGAEIARLERWAQEQRAGYADRIGALFLEYEAGADAALLVSIRTELNAWRYIERMLEQIHPGAITR